MYSRVCTIVNFESCLLGVLLVACHDTDPNVVQRCEILKLLLLLLTLFVGYQCEDDFTAEQAAQCYPENSIADQL